MNNPANRDFRVLPAAGGWDWLLQSLALLRAQGARLLLIAVLMQLILSLVQVPILGILVVLSVPGLSAGILEAFHRAGQGMAPPLAVLFAPLTSGRHLGRFYGMGGLVIGLSIICVSFVLGSTTEIDEALLMRLQQGDMAALEEIDPTFMSRLFAAFAVSVAVSGTLTFFSIPLVWFRDRKLGQSLGEGIKALVANWKPMLVLGLGLTVAFVPLFVLMLLSLQLAALGPIGASAGMGLVLVLVLLFQLLLFGTQYCSFRSIFGLESKPAEDEPGDSGQWVA